MQELKDKLIYICVIVFIVLVILFSNLGQSFKNDIVSPIDILNHINSFKSIWSNSRQPRQHSDYINSSSDFITGVLNSYNLKPLYEEGFIEEWESINPSIKYPSTLEVLSKARYGTLIKRYKYGEDYFEDFKGLLKPGSATAYVNYCDSIDNLEDSPNKILLFDGYHNKTFNEIESIDEYLMKHGVSSVISPSLSGDFKKDSGLLETGHTSTENGLIKLIVSQDTFEELKKLIKNGYALKIKSGSEIRSLKLKNIYGYIEGNNTSYKPLIIVAFYDGLYSNTGYSDADFEKYTISSSILLNTVRSVKFQRVKAPDRSIIFVFASGYLNNKEGLSKLFSRNIDGDVLVLDGFGKEDANFMSYSKNAKHLSDSVEYYLNKYDFKIISKNIFNNSENSFLYLIPSEEASGKADIPQLNRSGRFLLSFIGEECYNLDFLSGNIAEFRVLKRFVKDYSAILSLITMVFLTYVIFKDSSKKYH